MCLASLSSTLENYHYFSFSLTDAKLHLHSLKEVEKRQSSVEEGVYLKL